MKRYFLLICLTIFMVLPITAKAISVTNLDKVPHRLQIEVAGSTPEIVEIAPGDQWRSFTPIAYLRLLSAGQGTRLHTREYEEYVIWPGGDFGIQKQRRTKGSTF